MKVQRNLRTIIEGELYTARITATEKSQERNARNEAFNNDPWLEISSF